MKKTRVACLFLAVGLAWGGLLAAAAAQAGAVLKYSSSAQVMAATGSEIPQAVTKDTGVAIDLFVGSSSAAVHRMMNGLADVASSVERLAPGHKDSGYSEIGFARAPIVVITNVSTQVRDLACSQLQAIFSGAITNWKEVGGPDKEIVVVVPERNTGAFRNFSLLALKRFDVRYDFMASRSTDVVELVRRVPWSISFITQGAHTVHEALKTLRIAGRTPEDSDYPFHQDFSFVLNGEPRGISKKLIDFYFSEKGQELLRKNGLTPVTR